MVAPQKFKNKPGVVAPVPVTARGEASRTASAQMLKTSQPG